MRLLPRVLLGTVLVTLALALQLVILPHLGLPGAVPDLVLLVVVGFAFGHDQGESGGGVPDGLPETVGAVTGFCAGFAVDIAPPADHAIGRYAFVLCVVGWIAGRMSQVAQRSALRTMFLVGFLALGSVLLYAALGVVVGDHHFRLGRDLPTALAAGGYDALLAAFIVPGVRALAQRVGSVTSSPAAF